VSAEQVARAHYDDQVALAAPVAAAAAQAWSRVDPADVAGSWRRLLLAVRGVLSAAQLVAAAAAGPYLVELARQYQRAARPAGEPVPEAFAGVASDGRDLDALLYQPAIRTLTAVGAGAPVERALALGAVDLDMIVRTQVADAGRAADGVALVAHRQMAGYVRMLEPPSCDRCVVLAGRRYEWNAGFERHPRCDCRHIPVAEDVDDDLTTDPRAYFDSLSEAEQDRVFGRAGAEAIRAGADIGQVVNARRGMYTAGGRQFTTVAAGRRPRLMPEQIVTEAGGDRDEAIRLLRRHGYLTASDRSSPVPTTRSGAAAARSTPRTAARRRRG
jgi:hypothetical protein